jgi:hypothetical protein
MKRIAALLVLCGLASTLGAQTKVSLASIQAKVTGVRFFLGDSDKITDFDERFYPPQFDSATTKFITTEVELDYPKTTATVSFQLGCEYAGPPGSGGTAIMNGTIQAGWTGSYHATGWGAKSRGSWKVGSYTVTCRDGNRVVGSGNFSVTRDVFQIPEIKAVTTGVRFYEAGSEGRVLADRKYAVSFEGAVTRRVYLEYGVDYPETSKGASFKIDCQYDYPDDRSFPVPLTVTVQAGWTGSYHVASLGYEDPGHWPKGKYVVTCRYQGRSVARAVFHIT